MCIYCFHLVVFDLAFTEVSKLKSEVALSTSSLWLTQDFTELKEKIGQNSILALNNTFNQGQSQVSPALSCAAILLVNPSSRSCYYWITSSDDSAVRVFCDMTMACGNITGGWMRVASLDMRDNSTQCPSGLRENIIDGTTIRTCVNRNTETSCSSDIFSTYNLPYSNKRLSVWFYRCV